MKHGGTRFFYMDEFGQMFGGHRRTANVTNTHAGGLETVGRNMHKNVFVLGYFFFLRIMALRYFVVLEYESENPH